MPDHQQQLIIGGVDTHRDVHVVAAITVTGQLLGTCQFPATSEGYGQLTAWLTAAGCVVRVGIEGCGSYGAGLTRHLREGGIDVVEVTRPGRRLRRRRGKSDVIDAEAAARCALADDGSVTPKTQDGPIEAIRAIRIARASAIKARDQATNQIHALLVTAPEPIRARFTNHRIRQLVAELSEAHEPLPGLRVCCTFW